MQDIREKLIDLLTGYSLDTYEDVQYVADELIAKSVVPVVRCKDCKHRDPENNHCDHVAGVTIYFPRKDDDFCSYGEKKAGD